MASVYGYNPPFYDGKYSILPRQEDERLIKNDLLQLLLTVPGERYYRPNFGVGIRNYLFDPLDPTMLNQLRVNILNQIGINEPRVRDVKVILTPNDAQNGLKIQISCYMRNKPDTFINIEQFFTGG
jgi:phage baseplate assembly protein W